VVGIFYELLLLRHGDHGIGEEGGMAGVASIKEGGGNMGQTYDMTTVCDEATKHVPYEYDLVRLTEIARYWHDVSTCQCGSPHPIGGCLKCDLEEALAILRKEEVL
jgi:hypothetical protein